ncbi:MAG: acetolactate synthase small subunit [Alphaproteobacteria bacterium]
MPPIIQQIETHVFSVLVDNEPGVLARVIGLFSGRGYNIESLTVASVDNHLHLSRITLVTSGTRMVIEQIRAQLSRLVPVRKVVDLTDDGPHVAREIALVKICNKGEQRIEALQLANVYRARVVDSTPNSFIFEITGSSHKIDAFIGVMEPLGMVEIVRTGVVALTRGENSFI